MFIIMIKSFKHRKLETIGDPASTMEIFLNKVALPDLKLTYNFQISRVDKLVINVLSTSMYNLAGYAYIIAIGINHNKTKTSALYLRLNLM